MTWKTIERDAKKDLIELRSVQMKNKKGFYYATFAVNTKTQDSMRLTSKSFLGGINYLISLGAIDKRITQAII